MKADAYAVGAPTCVEATAIEPFLGLPPPPVASRIVDTGVECRLST